MKSLVAPSFSQIEEAAKDGSIPESYVQKQTVMKRRKTRCIKSSLTVNDAIDALSNSNKWSF